MNNAQDFYPNSEVWASPESLEWLSLLQSTSPQAVRAREIELARCKHDPWYWLTHWVLTEDSQEPDNPFQPFPNKKHLQIVCHYWLHTLKLLCPKSRQLSFTWLFTGLYLHNSMFHPSRYTVFQCKNELDSDVNLRRSVVMWEKLPEWQKEWQPMKYTYCNAFFPRSRSTIIAVPEGDRHFRQKTLTGVFLDEAAFTDGLQESVAACKPALGIAGRLSLISSAAPGSFHHLVMDN